MDLSVADIARLVNGQVEGSGDVRITGVAPLETAKKTDLSFLKNNPNKKTKSLYDSTQAGVVLVPSTVAPNGRTVIRTSDPTAALAAILGVIDREKNKKLSGRHASAFVDPSATLGRDCWVGPYAVVESGAKIGEGAQLGAFSYVGPRAEVGANTVLHPHVTVREEVRIGAECVIHSGAVLGADGYGFYFANGRHNKIPQIGTVVLEDYVEVGACTAIDRATIGETRIGKGTKIDNLVQIAHNVVIGENSLIVAQVGIAGSCHLGKGVVLAGQAGVADHLTIGDGAMVGGQAGVKTDLAPGGAYWGTPAIPLAEKLRESVWMRRLPNLIKKLGKNETGND